MWREGNFSQHVFIKHFHCQPLEIHLLPFGNVNIIILPFFFSRHKEQTDAFCVNCVHFIKRTTNQPKISPLGGLLWCAFLLIICREVLCAVQCRKRRVPWGSRGRAQSGRGSVLLLLALRIKPWMCCLLSVFCVNMQVAALSRGQQAVSEWQWGWAGGWRPCVVRGLWQQLSLPRHAQVP